VRDGARISWAILLLFRDYRPMAFFGAIGVVLLAVASGLFAISGGVGRAWFLPTDILAELVAIAGILAVCVGATVSVLARRFQELESKVDMVTTADISELGSPGDPGITEGTRHRG
jgi:hypothetical protein